MSQGYPPPSGDDLYGEPQVPVETTYPAVPPPPVGYPPQGYEPVAYPAVPFQPGAAASLQVPPPMNWQPFVPAPRNHWKWIVPLVGVAALVTGLLAYLILRDPHPEDASTAGRHLQLPPGVDGYGQLRSYDTGTIKDRFSSLAGRLGATGEQLVDSSVVGAYATSPSAATPQLVFIAFPLKIVPELADEIRDRGTDGAVREIMNAANASGDEVTKVDPGKLGGAMSCLEATQLGTVVGLCGWADRSFVALTIVQQPPSRAALQKVALDLRNAAER